MGDWHEDDELWEALAPGMFSPARIESAADEVEGLLELASIPPRSRILDLCAGIGRHAVELAKRGHRVTAVDRTATFIETTSRNAAEAGVELEAIAQDVRTFVRERSYDAVLNLFTSYGYFADEADNLTVARHMLASLDPRGVAVIDLAGKELVARNFKSRWWWETEGVFVAEERTVSEDWTALRSRWVVFRNGQRREFSGVQRIYSGAELRDLLLHAGFARVELYGDFRGAPYDADATRLVALAFPRP